MELVRNHAETVKTKREKKVFNGDDDEVKEALKSERWFLKYLIRRFLFVLYYISSIVKPNFNSLLLSIFKIIIKNSSFCKLNIK